MRRLPRPADHANVKKPNRAARVIAAWLRETDFLDGDEPAVLPIEGNGATFSELVRRYSGDVTAGTVLYELTRVGAVERQHSWLIAIQEVRLPQPGRDHPSGTVGLLRVGVVGRPREATDTYDLLAG